MNPRLKADAGPLDSPHVLAMPRCGSHEVFEGTELVAGGGSTSTVMTEHGAYTSGSTELRTEHVAVVECKACGEILVGAQFYYTPEDLANMKAEARARKAANAKRKKYKVCKEFFASSRSLIFFGLY